MYERNGAVYWNGHRGYREYHRGYRRHGDFWFPLAAFATGALITGAIVNNQNRYADAHVGKPLHGPVGRYHAAVDPKHRLGRGAFPVLAHGVEQIARLEGDGFQRGARELRRTRIAGQAEDGAPRFRVPVRRAEPDEGRHQIDLLRRIGGGRQRTALIRLADHLDAVAQPLHGSTRDEDRAFQRIGGLAVETIGDGGQEPVLRAYQ